MNILITGGAGFIGSHLTDTCIALGHSVWIIDHHLREKKRFINERAQLLKAHIADQAVKQLLHKVHFDIVFHLAAQISVTHSLANPLNDARQNLFDAMKLLSWCGEAKVGKFVFASSGGAVYGDHPILPTPLTDEIYAASPYGINKRAFEVALEAFAPQIGIKYTILRFANLFGPRQQLIRPVGEGNVFAIILNRLLITGEPIIIFGRGDSSRDYVYIDDAVDALIRAGESEFQGTVNVSTGVGITIRQLVDKLLIIHGRPHPLRYEPFRSGEVFQSILDPQSAKENLGWEPKTPFDTGLRNVYNWYASTFEKNT